MNNDLINTLILAGSFLALFAIGEFLYHILKVKVELTRKTVHAGTGVLTMLFPILLSSHWWVLALCSSFALILVVSLKYNLLKSINAIERESVGSILYPISVYGAYLTYAYSDELAFFYLPILILAFCDPIAALCGKKWSYGKYTLRKSNKTLMGSGMFFISALILYFTVYFLGAKDAFSVDIVFQGLIIALVSAMTEAISGKGYDNLTIPVSVILCLLSFG